MDIDDIRLMIRAAIKTQISKAVRRRRRLPETFSEFNSLLREVVSESDIDHDTVYEMWENISLETDGVIGSASQKKEWNNSLEYYVSKTFITNNAKVALLKHLKR